MGKTIDAVNATTADWQDLLAKNYDYTKSMEIAKIVTELKYRRDVPNAKGNRGFGAVSIEKLRDVTSVRDLLSNLLSFHHDKSFRRFDRASEVVVAEKTRVERVRQEKEEDVRRAERDYASKSGMLVETAKDMWAGKPDYIPAAIIFSTHNPPFVEQEYDDLLPH